MKRLWSLHRFFRAALLSTLLFTAALAVSSAPESRAAEDGSVSGVVTNGTTGEPLVGATIVLSRFAMQSDVVDQTTTTDSKGEYQFTGLDTSDGFVHVTSVTYLDVIYASGMLRLNQEQQITADLTVFETTTDQRALAVTSRGIVLTAIDSDAGSATFLDVFALTFDSDRTLVQGDDGRTVRFPVPATASEASPGTGFNFGTPSIVGSTVYATGPLFPGETTATLSWVMPYVGDNVEVEVDNAYPTGSVRVLVPSDSPQFGTNLTIEGDGFVDAGTITLGDVEYRVWSTATVEPGEIVSFQVSGLPVIERTTNRLRTVEPLLIVTAAMLGAIATTFWLVRKRRLALPRPMTLAPAVAAPLEERRAELIEQLRALEVQHADGAIDDQSYALERRGILLDLRSISRQMRGDGDDE